MLQVRGYAQHPGTDLAALTAELPGPAVPEIRTLPLSLRMPEDESDDERRDAKTNESAGEHSLSAALIPV